MGTGGHEQHRFLSVLTVDGHLALGEATLQGRANGHGGLWLESTMAEFFTGETLAMLTLAKHKSQQTREPDQPPMLNLKAFLARASALELARRSEFGAPVFVVISLIMLMGTPISQDFGWLIYVEALTLILLGVIRVAFARRFEAHYDRVGETAVFQFSILAALQSLALGVIAGVVIWNYWATQEIVLTITLSAGCIAAGTSALSIRQSARIIFLVCILAPFGIAVYLVGGLAKCLLIIGFLVLMAFLVQDGGRGRRLFEQQLRDNYDAALIKQWTQAEQLARKKMITDMNHRFRTPINSIMGMTSLLLDESLDQRSLEFATIIRNSGIALLEMIEQDGDFIARGKDNAQSERVLVNLKEQVSKVVCRFREQAELKGIQLETRLEDLPESVSFFDDNHVEQVLVNLLNNAVAHTVRGTVKVSACCEQQADHVMRIEFAVSDTGPGLTESQVNTAFLPLDGLELMSGEKPGRGLGLPMSKGLTELMGGEIWIEPGESQGTTVRFTIRVQVDSGDASWHSASSVLEEEPYGQHGALAERYPLEILVVEDHEINRRVLVQLFAKMGYSAKEAVDGPQAVAAAMSGAYDLIFMDIRMPEMSGIEATRWIREHCCEQQLRIVALTGEATKESRARCFAAGMNDFIAKPVQIPDLEKILRDTATKLNTAGRLGTAKAV